uniref:Serine protease inhibitor n=1 Tax=Clitocybe nebularis TaxID=117024 RepID=B8Y499_CLINE|nr:serine proteinase inhibitor [Clitocybe nebularis]ACR84419.1 serine protease inhibitor [Clitocybe nebularis]
MSFKLPSDQYYIRNGRSFAGRALHEDHSLNPKPVICPTDDTNDLWIVEALPNGHYILRARGAPTAEHDGYVYAFLQEREEKKEWIITLRPDQDHQYTIQEATGKGWIAETGDEGHQRIAVGPLPTTKSDPPQFLGSALWTIQPLVD